MRAIANAVGTKNVVLWPAAKGVRQRIQGPPRLLREVRGGGELPAGLRQGPPRAGGDRSPTSPSDHAYLRPRAIFSPFIFTTDPSRVGVLIESAHALLAVSTGHRDRPLPVPQEAVERAPQRPERAEVRRGQGLRRGDLKRAFDQVLVLYENDYGANGEFVGLDVEGVRTQKDGAATAHLTNSVKIFNDLLAVVKKVDRKKIADLRAARDYEELEYYIVSAIMGRT